MPLEHGPPVQVAIARKNKPQSRCCECGKVTRRAHPILDVFLCANCRRASPEKYRYITKTRALQEFRLKPEELSMLGVYEVDNPHYKKAAPMQLYLLTQVRDMSNRKWRTAEPYAVQYVPFSDELLGWLVEDTERLKSIGPDRLEALVADLLAARGFEVRLVGNTRRKDGGVDIVAWPRLAVSIPFLMAVQVKHHRVERKTGAPSVREFHGVLAAANSPFNIGMVVTNTAFTADAHWFGENNKALLRLRDGQDLARWMKQDFDNPSEWREIPESIELAPGVTIAI
ncbi:MAG: restriction endonuclease, partial [Pirellulales bacterium]